MNPLLVFYEEFPDTGAARSYLESVRWPRGPRCPRCNSKSILSSFPSRPTSHRCRDCSYFFSVTSQTPMHLANMDLRKWLLLWWLIAHTRRPLSGPQIARALEVDLHRAWDLTRVARLTLSKIRPKRLRQLNPVPLQSDLGFEPLLGAVLKAGRVR